MRGTKTKFLSAAAAATMAALALTACGSDSGDEPAADGAFTPVNDGQLTVCSDIPYEPFEFVKDGKNVGFDLDLAAEIAKDAELDLNVIDASFDSIESGLFKNQCDIAISGISITEERKGNMNFSDPYMDDDLMLVAKDGSGITDLDSAKDKKVGVQQATTGEKYGQDNGLTQIVGYEDGGLQVQALKAGNVEAALGNQSVLGYAIKDEKGFSVVANFTTGEQLGVALPKGGTEITDKVNATLKRLNDDGEMAKLTEKWFGGK